MYTKIEALAMLNNINKLCFYRLMYILYIYIYRILWLSPLRTFHDALYCLLLVFQTAVVHAQSETNQFAIQFVLPFNEGLVYNYVYFSKQFTVYTDC